MSDSLIKEQQKIKPEHSIAFKTTNLEKSYHYPVYNSEQIQNNLLKGSASENKIIAIGGGKGGVGKTVLTTALGIGLSSFNYKVTMVDADFGGANLHTCMGIMEPEMSYYDFAFRSKTNLQNITIDTQIDNLKLICGPTGVLGGANPKYFQKRKYIKQLRHLESDYTILDLGAGSSFNTLDFFLLADQGVLVTTPDSAAFNETFNFLKMCLMRYLVKSFQDNPQVTSILKTNFYAENGQIKIPLPQLLEQIKTVDIESYFHIQHFLQSYQPKLLLNMVGAQQQVNEGNSFQVAAKELLGIHVDFIGFIDYDLEIRRSSRHMIPFLLKQPDSKTSKNISKIITNGLLKKNGFDSLNHRKKIIKSIKRNSANYQNQASASENICSVKCFYWKSCEYRKGGFPCVLRKLDPVFFQ